MTDGDGNLLTFCTTPIFLPGVETVSVTTGGLTGNDVFTVIEGAAVVQPLPTPSPSALPADALASLIQGENLLRVWTFNNDSKTWEFFDSRPAFVNANNINRMVPSYNYWFHLKRGQAASLNGRVVYLFKGWNLVPWCVEAEFSAA